MRKIIAIQIAGTLSQTSKMPCKSFGLPTSTCNVGARLRGIPGSSCVGRYADKGFYKLYPTVSASQEKRLNLLNEALADAIKAREWLDAIQALIGTDEYFRFHDSGDIFSERYASLIWQVAIENPTVQFWIPTKESALVRACIAKWGHPDNLIIRLSMPMVDQAPTESHGMNTSTIHRFQESHGFECGAPSRGGYCGDCRACWNKDVKNVSYKYH